MFRETRSRQLCSRFVEDERGVSLIVVAVMILVLVGMCSFVLDYGLVWAARRQAQNAADAGALAGAQALAKDDSTWTAFPAPLNAAADASANGIAQTNQVLGATPGTEALARCPGWMVAPNNVNCVEVNVYRDGTHGSTTFPVFFSRLIGQTSQSIRATATAQMMSANASGCMRPWFISDWYNDLNMNNVYDPGTDTYTFPGYAIDNPLPSPPNPPGLGATVVFHGNGGPSSYGQLDVGTGAADIRTTIQRCYAGPSFAAGDGTEPCPSTWCVATQPGNALGPERQGITDLLTWDPDAGGVHWDPVKKEIVGGCSAAGNCVCGSGPCPYGGTQSPRIVQAAICAPLEATCNGTVPGAGFVHIRNILSFFITGCDGNIGSCPNNPGAMDINAILIGSAGMMLSGGAPGTGKSFVTVQLLVR